MGGKHGTDWPLSGAGDSGHRKENPLDHSDCDLSLVDVPILGNDAAVKSIELVISALVEAYEAGVKSRPAPSAAVDGVKVEAK